MKSSFLSHVWKVIRQNIVEYLTILISFIVLGLSVLNMVDLKIVTGAILAVLSLQAIILLANRRTEKELKLSLEKLLNQQHQLKLSDIIVPFGDGMQDLSNRFAQADEVWILGRTCQRLWSDYQDELQKVARRDGLKFLLIDPSDGVLDMIAKSAIWQIPGAVDRLKIDVELSIDLFKHFKKTANVNKFEVRVINYLPAWMLILINPGRQDGVVCVEMATYRAHPRKRPSFVVKCGLDNALFEQFCNEFEEMWNDAESAWEQAIPSLPQPLDRVN